MWSARKCCIPCITEYDAIPVSDNTATAKYKGNITMNSKGAAISMNKNKVSFDTRCLMQAASPPMCFFH